MPGDYDWLYPMLAGGGPTAVRWRFRGSTPDPAKFEQLLWAGVEVQFVAAVRENDQPFGLLQLYGYNATHGYGYFAFVVAPGVEREGWPIEAAVLFLNYCFVSLPLRKIYIETLEFIADDFGSAIGRVFDQEARLVQHEYHDGKYWDALILSVTRESWEQENELVQAVTDDL